MRHKAWYFILLVALVCSCQQKELTGYKVIEDKVYDIPVKSQISLRVELNDSTISKQQIVDLLRNLSDTQMSRSMKYHSKPTHVFIYLYNSKSDYDINSGCWIAMYQKIGKDDPGNFSYKEKSLD